MSTLNVSNITDGTDTVATGYVVNGSAKAWLNMNGQGTIAVRDSFNVASLTDNGTGNYTVNLSNAFGAADFAVSGCSGGNGTSPATNTCAFLCPQQTASSFVLRTGASSSDSDVDRALVFSSTHGDLA